MAAFPAHVSVRVLDEEGGCGNDLIGLQLLIRITFNLLLIIAHLRHIDRRYLWLYIGWQRIPIWNWIQLQHQRRLLNLVLLFRRGTVAGHVDNVSRMHLVPMDRSFLRNLHAIT